MDWGFDSGQLTGNLVFYHRLKCIRNISAQLVRDIQQSSLQELEEYLAYAPILTGWLEKSPNLGERNHIVQNEASYTFCSC
jgi:hypothetical protein